MKSPKAHLLVHILCLLLVLGMAVPAVGADSDNKFRPVPPSLQHQPEPVPDLSGKETLSLNEAMALAYKYNPDLRKAELNLDRAEILRDLAAQTVTFLPTGDLLVTPEGRSMINSYEKADTNWKAAKKTNESEKLRIEKEVLTAYAEAIKNYNLMDLARVQLQDMEQQNYVYQVATVQGVVSNLDLRSSKRGLQQLQDSLEAYQAAYELSLATLRSLLNQGPQWKPVLTSRPVLGDFQRAELFLELSRGENQSIMMLQADTLLKMEESKVYWGLGSKEEDPYMDKLNLYLRELDYEQARRDTRSTVEQLYHRIDALEKQIAIYESTLEQKEQDLETAQLMYEVGLMPYRSLRPTEPCLATAEMAVQRTKLELENMRADLAAVRATFAYLTGQSQVYSKLDWKEIV